LNGFDLLDSQRRVLACLIRFGVKASNPTADIFVKKSTIAKWIGANEATVYRSLARLTELGLIERDSQTRIGKLMKAVSKIRLTAVAVQRLGLDSPIPAASRARLTNTIERSGEDYHGTGLAPMQDVNTNPTQSSMKKQPQRGLFEKIGNRTVPVDLAWLHRENSLSLSGIFKLMKAARVAGSRLSDVVAHANDAIRPIKGRELYAYLTALVGLPIDHASKARQRDADRLERESEAAEKRTRAETVKEISSRTGSAYTAPDGRQWLVGQGAFVVIAATGAPSGSVPYAMAPEAISGILSGAWPAVGQNRQRKAADEKRSHAAKVGVRGLKEVLTLRATAVLDSVPDQIKCV
jgi:hypothetical protein